MKSIQSQVVAELKKNTSITCKEMINKFPDVPEGTIKSSYYRSKKVATIDDTVATDRITLDLVEKLIMAGKTKPHEIRSYLDFLKIKSMDHSELEEIDLTIFYKKAMEDE